MRVRALARACLEGSRQALAALLGLQLAAACRPRAAEPTLVELDGFEESTAWEVKASDGVRASAESIAGQRGRALRFSFDFQGHGGHAGVRRALPLSLPANYELTLDLRGDAPPNDLQFKLLDASGDNVWWFRKSDFELPRGWQSIRFKKRQLEFAWGTTTERELKQPASLELVVAAGSGGGRGHVDFDRLSLRELPLPPEKPPPILASASASLPGAGSELALDGRLDTAWRAPAEAGRTQRLTLDLGYVREFGGLVLRWVPGAHASLYDVECSEDGEHWQLARRVSEGNGASDFLALPESAARFVRLNLQAGPGPEYALAELELQGLAFGASPNAFVTALAREARRGAYPRGFSGEQAYWTLVGVDGGSASGLLSEDGALELGRGGPTLEPFVIEGSSVVSWADVQITHALREGYLPIPSVRWRHPDWELEVSTFARGSATNVELAARYVLHNTSSRPLALQLALALRPFQVNPPSQSLNRAGGVSHIQELRWDGSALWVGGRRSLSLLTPPGAVVLAAFDAAEFPERAPGQSGSAARQVEDATGLASGVLVYTLELAPGQSAALGALAPLLPASGQPPPTQGPVPLSVAPAPEAPSAAPALEPITSLAELDRAEQAVAAGWREQLNRVAFELPVEGQPWVDTLRSSLAHILMSRDGPMLRPGTRSYARSWIRDGAMMSESLLRLGHAAAAAEYLDWYAPYQFESGKVPCCVDARGADPVPEHDSPGQLIFLAAEIYRVSGDRARLERAWPTVEKAAGYLEQLRQSERSPKNEVPERRALYGLLPPSISHEGYSDKPAYSYWDDFWALIGYQDAAWIAEVLEQRPARQRLAAQRDEFTRELYASLRSTAKQHHIGFIAGAADRGDFDATSTTIALAPGREAERLPRDLLLGTFERYWQEFEARRSGAKAWDVFTPYELRVAGSFIRLGWRERAGELFDYFLGSRRPAAWNQWAEVVGREARQQRFIGDMPHAWIASDYIRSVLDGFAYARESDSSLVLLAGVPPSWFSGKGLAVRGLLTRYGPMGISVSASAQRVHVEVSGRAPPGGCVLPWPWAGAPSALATVNGEPAHWLGGELRFQQLPAQITIDRR